MVDRGAHALPMVRASGVCSWLYSLKYQFLSAFKEFEAMSPSGAEILRQIKSRIDEVDPAAVREQISDGTLVVDVRQDEEWAAGHIPGAVHVPKSHLESRIEGAAPDRAQHVVLYCASGQRSAWAARTLIEDLGYEHVASMTGGFTLWKDRGYEVDVPRFMSAEQRNRYSRHLLLPEVGIEGQQKLLDAKVLLLGAGGLGSPAALYLAAAGVGTLGIVDDDVVDVSNLQRQVIHTTERVGVSKVDSAEETIAALNPDVQVVKHKLRLGPDNIMDILPGYDIVVDGLDNFPTRYLLNDASVRLRIPVVSAAILGFDGQLSVFKPYEGPCYRCLFPTPPPAELAPSCGANGVIGVLPGTMGLLQATEVIKLILDVGNPAIGRLLMYDALAATITEVKVRRDPECPICSRDPDEISDEEMGAFPDYEAFCAGAH
jgi:molybdopterin/thiamine biosynthesis adenylyltransferase/rhodanese-related sulfurtransferase